jgi:N-terminal region of glycosyl transferase group 7
VLCCAQLFFLFRFFATCGFLFRKQNCHFLQNGQAMRQGVVVIVPYRKRRVQLLKLMAELQTSGRNVSAVVVAEQGNTAEFNRGAVKNAGFEMAVADLGLEDMDTVVFHDVDVCPEATFKAYPTCVPGVINHLYGHDHCLGGVVCVTVGDFKKMGMFAHWDYWGREDVHLNDSAKDNGININRRNFTPRLGPKAGKPSRTDFFEMDADGNRESFESLRTQLMEKMAKRDETFKQLHNKPELTQGPRFTKCLMGVVSPAPVLSRHYFVFP